MSYKVITFIIKVLKDTGVDRTLKSLKWLWRHETSCSFAISPQCNMSFTQLGNQSQMPNSMSGLIASKVPSIFQNWQVLRGKQDATVHAEEMVVFGTIEQGKATMFWNNKLGQTKLGEVFYT
jgi:hypothetical protein